MNTKNINLEKIISTIIGEKFVEFTLLGERIFVPINGLDSFVFEEKSVIKLKGIDGFNYEINGENKFMESYKDQLRVLQGKPEKLFWIQQSLLGIDGQWCARRVQCQWAEQWSGSDLANSGAFLFSIHANGKHECIEILLLQTGG